MLLSPKSVDFDASWSRIRETMTAVLSFSPVVRSVWNDRFTDIYNLCIAYPESMAPRLYSEIRSFFEVHVSNLRIKIQSSSDAECKRMGDDDDDAGGGRSDLLAAYHTEWVQYSRGMSYLHLLMSYLNHQHIRLNQPSDADLTYGSLSVPVNSRSDGADYGASRDDGIMMEIGELGLDIWKRHMIVPLKSELTRLLMTEFQRMRTSQCGSSVPTFVNQGCQFTMTSNDVLHGVIQSLVAVEKFRRKFALDLYQTVFETPLMESTASFYASQSGQMLQDDTTSVYMQKVIECLKQEDERSKQFLHETSRKKIRTVCEEQMVAVHLSTLYAECKSIVQNESNVDLANMYKLLKPITAAQIASHANASEIMSSSHNFASATVSSGNSGALHLLISCLEDHIKFKGIESITSLRNESTFATDFVTNILAIHDHFRSLISSLFDSDPLFGNAMDRSMMSIVNYRIKAKKQDSAADVGGKQQENLLAVCGQHSRAPELLARYCDSLLRKAAATSKMTESEMDSKLQRSIFVFRYLDDKDVFQRFYGKNLGKRLIHQQSQSMSLEEGMINRLKEACGYEFTTKFRRMYTDIALADDMNAKFTEHLRLKSIDVGINFFIRILQPSAWPLSHQASTPSNSSIDSSGMSSRDTTFRSSASADAAKIQEQSLLHMIVPPPLQCTIAVYEKFYGAQFSGRKLTWLHYLSNVDIRMNLSASSQDKTYIVNVTTFQLAILWPFQNRNSVSLVELQGLTQITVDQFVRHLQSLVEAKILTVSSSSSHLVDDGINTSYSHGWLVRAGEGGNMSTNLNADLFVHLNVKFTSKKTKFRVAGAAVRMVGDISNQSPSVSNETESLTQTHQAIDEDRKMYVQAAIVRIMKARKVMKHSHLVQEVISQCRVRFSPSISVIKKSIEAVIEKAYIERTPNTSDQYSYIA